MRRVKWVRVWGDLSDGSVLGLISELVRVRVRA
jgi:hypothetical protein